MRLNISITIYKGDYIQSF